MLILSIFRGSLQVWGGEKSTFMGGNGSDWGELGVVRGVWIGLLT